MIHASHTPGDKPMEIRFSLGGQIADLKVWTEYPPDNSPDDAKPSVHVIITDPISNTNN